MKDDEFERLYSEQAQSLFAFLAYRTGDRVLAEDLLADAFERALRARFNPRKGSAKTWLYAIALNVLRDHVRRVAAEGRAYAKVDSGEAGADPFAGVEVRDELLRALAGLAAEEREAISLALRRRPDRARDGHGARRSAHDGRGPRLPRAAQAPRGANVRRGPC